MVKKERRVSRSHFLGGDGRVRMRERVRVRVVRRNDGLWLGISGLGRDRAENEKRLGPIFSSESERASERSSTHPRLCSSTNHAMNQRGGSRYAVCKSRGCLNSWSGNIPPAAEIPAEKETLPIHPSIHLSICLSYLSIYLGPT